MNTMTTTLDTVVLFISQLGEVKRSTDLIASMELTFGIISIGDRYTHHISSLFIYIYLFISYSKYTY